MWKIFAAAAVALSMSSAALAQAPLRVGIIPTSTPFSFLDITTGKFDGAMVEIMRELATSGGFDIKVEAAEWRAIIPSLQSDKIDIMNAAVTITPARAEIIDFSEPLFPYNESLIVKSTDSTNYTHAKDLAGKVVGVMPGTTYFAYLQSVGGFAEIRTYDTIADIVRDIELGRLAAGFVDYPIMKYRIAQKMYSNIRLVESYRPAVIGEVALAVKRGNSKLLATLNAEISKLKQSGRLAEILAKWSVN